MWYLQGMIIPPRLDQVYGHGGRLASGKAVISLEENYCSKIKCIELVELSHKNCVSCHEKKSRNENLQ